MKEKEKNLPNKHEAVQPLVFDNINMSIPQESFGNREGMPVLFFNKDGNDNALFNAPNPYDYVMGENKTLFEHRFRLDQMIRDQTVERDANGIPLDAAEFHNNILSDNVINKMLDTIEYNCTIIAAQGLYGLIKDYFTPPTVKDDYTYCNDIHSLLGFNRIRARFNTTYVRYHRDMVGKYILFESYVGDQVRGERPQYCKDNNVLNTMLNLKITILNDLAYNYGGFINFIVNSNCYNIRALAMSLSDTSLEDKDITSTAIDYSFVIGCLNEQAKNDIAKMSDIIEIAVIDALHTFINNCVVTEVHPVRKVTEIPVSHSSMSNIPGIKNYRKLDNGIEIGEF